MQLNVNNTGRDSLLLTVTFPPNRRVSKPFFHAAMISFPQGAVQQVADQLQDKTTLQQILSGLEHNPDNLEEITEQMAGRGCPGVEITPVEMVGYYQLQTESIQMKGEM